MTRVLFVLPRFCHDGPSHFVARLAKALDRTRFEVRVCSFSAITAPHDDLPATSLGCDSVLDVRALPRLRAVLREWRPDVVHTMLLRPDWYGRIAARSMRVPVICTTVQNEDDLAYASEQGRGIRLVAEAINRITARAAHAIVAVSEGVRAYAAERQKLPPKKLLVIPNSVDIAEFKPGPRTNVLRELCGIPSDAIVVGTLAGLKEQKGLTFLIDAAAIARRNHPELHFVIAGSGPREAELRERIARRGLGDAVHLIGQYDDIAGFLRGIDFFALPSMWEGMPLALLEAMASGLASVVTDIGGSREAITDRVNGLIVPRADPERLAAAIEELAMNPSLRSAFGAAARETAARRFSSQVVAGEYARLYERLLRGTMAAKQRPIRVVHLVPSFLLPHGPSAGILTQIEHHDPARVQSSVFAMYPPPPGRDASELLAQRGIPYRSLGMRRSFLDARVLRPLVKALKEEAPDILHCHLLRANLYGRVAGRLAGVRRIISTVRGIEPYMTAAGGRASLARLAEAASARGVDAYVAVSERVRAAAIRTLRLDPANVIPILNAVDLAPYRAMPARAARERVVIGTAGMLEPRKNHALLVRAMTELPHATLIIAGEGEGREPLLELIHRMNLQDRVVLAGLVRDIPAFLADLDIFAMSSSAEGLPRALMEAMAAGLPAVVTDAGGSAEAVQEGETGFVVPVDDEAALVDRLRRLASDAELRRRMGEAARRRAFALFDPARMAAEYAALYERLAR